MSYEAIIDEVVSLWIKQGRAFTAYEVSKEVQSRLKEDKQPFVRHLEMRDYYAECQPLINEVRYGSYVQTVIDVGAPDPANLFHPDTYDPRNYKPMKRDGNKAYVPAVVGQGGAVVTGSQTPANMIFTPNQTPAAPATTNTVMVNQGDELWIGSQHLAAIGLSPGAYFEMYKDGDTVVIVREAPTGSPLLKKMIVEQKGNSRLSRQARNNFGFDGNSFSIVTGVDKVVISEV